MDWDSDPELKQMRQEFVASISERRIALLPQLKALKEAGDLEQAGDALQGIRLIAHRLAGVAESFGFPALGEVSAGLDDCLYKVIEQKDGNPAASDAKNQITDFTEFLAASLDAAAGGKDPVSLLSSPIVKRLKSFSL